MLSDSSHEIRQQADSALSEFLQEIKNSPVRLLLTFCSLTVGFAPWPLVLKFLMPRLSFYTSLWE